MSETHTVYMPQYLCTPTARHIKSLLFLARTEIEPHSPFTLSLLLLCLTLNRIVRAAPAKFYTQRPFGVGINSLELTQAVYHPRGYFLSKEATIASKPSSFSTPQEASTKNASNPALVSPSSSPSCSPVHIERVHIKVKICGVQARKLRSGRTEYYKTRYA